MTINFLTSNKKKASDFLLFGFDVQEFSQEVPEIKSNDVLEVALHKAKDTNINNTVVEDTALYIEGTNFFGTDIKHIYSEIENNEKYDEYKALWKLCLCMKKDNEYFLAVGELEGILKYPYAPTGYNFEKLLAVSKNNEYVHFSMLSHEEQVELSPRYQALRKLRYALSTNDFSNLIRVEKREIKEWVGEYQIEKEVKSEKSEVADTINGNKKKSPR